MVSPRHLRLAAALAAVLWSAPSHAGFINHWTFDDADTSGASALANGSSADTGTISGGVTTGASGQLGQAYSFNGTTGRVDISGWSGILGTGARTTSAWISNTSQGTASTVGPTILAWGLPSGGIGSTWWQTVNYAGPMTIGGSRVSLSSGNITSASAVNDGSFRHVLISMPSGSDGSAPFTIYTNGVADTGVRNTVAINTLASLDAAIGVNPDLGGNNFFDGTIDDVAVWDEDLTTGEVVGLYNVAIENGLAYNANNFNDLKEVHDAMSGSVRVGDYVWSFTTGLTGSDGDLTELGSDFSLLLDASAGTGVFGQFTPPLAPEPSTFVLFALCAALIAGWMMRRRGRVPSAT